MAGPWDLRIFNSIGIQICKGASHFRRNDFVRLAMKDADLRNFFLRENCFERSDVVEPVPKESTQREVDLCPDHSVHGGEGRNDQNLANWVIGCELEGGCPSERVAQNAKSLAAQLPTFRFQKSLERAFCVLKDCLGIWSSLTDSVAWIVDQQIAAAWIRKSADQAQPGQGAVPISAEQKPNHLGASRNPRRARRKRFACPEMFGM